MAHVAAITPTLPRNSTKAPTEFIAATRRILLVMMPNALNAAVQKLLPSIAEKNIQ